MKSVLCKELRDLTGQQLAQKIDEMRRKWLELRLSAVTKHVASFASTKHALRRSIARALTIQKEQQSGVRKV